jgi:multiple sugar transport system permease protein
MTLRHRFRHEVQAYGFLGPALLLLGLLMVYPLLQVLRMSLYEVNLRKEVWVGLGNYTALFSGRPPSSRWAAW